MLLIFLLLFGHYSYSQFTDEDIEAKNHIVCELQSGDLGTRPHSLQTLCSQTELVGAQPLALKSRNCNSFIFVLSHTVPVTELVFDADGTEMASQNENMKALEYTHLLEIIFIC